LHPVGCQPDANFIQWSASLMQISFSRPPWMQIASGYSSLAVYVKYPNLSTVCMWLATNQMKFASCWQISQMQILQK
jgi:hypothetical protein